MALECNALLSYDYRSRHGVEHLGCTRLARFMWRDSKSPVCWQHSTQASLDGPAVPIDEQAAREWWGRDVREYRPGDVAARKRANL